MCDKEKEVFKQFSVGLKARLEELFIEQTDDYGFVQCDEGFNDALEKAIHEINMYIDEKIDSACNCLHMASIGDKKQAVKEFAEKLKEKMELNGYRSLLHNRIIDELFTELYGADE